MKSNAPDRYFGAFLISLILSLVLLFISPVFLHLDFSAYLISTNALQMMGNQEISFLYILITCVVLATCLFNSTKVGEIQTIVTLVIIQFYVGFLMAFAQGTSNVYTDFEGPNLGMLRVIASTARFPDISTYAYSTFPSFPLGPGLLSVVLGADSIESFVNSTYLFILTFSLLNIAIVFLIGKRILGNGLVPALVFVLAGSLFTMVWDPGPVTITIVFAIFYLLTYNVNLTRELILILLFAAFVTTGDELSPGIAMVMIITLSIVSYIRTKQIRLIHVALFLGVLLTTWWTFVASSFASGFFSSLLAHNGGFYTILKSILVTNSLSTAVGPGLKPVLWVTVIRYYRVAEFGVVVGIAWLYSIVKSSQVSKSRNPRYLDTFLLPSLGVVLLAPFSLGLYTRFLGPFYFLLLFPFSAFLLRLPGSVRLPKHILSGKLSIAFVALVALTLGLSFATTSLINLPSYTQSPVFASASYLDSYYIHPLADYAVGMTPTFYGSLGMANVKDAGAVFFSPQLNYVFYSDYIDLLAFRSSNPDFFPGGVVATSVADVYQTYSVFGEAGIAFWTPIYSNLSLGSDMVYNSQYSSLYWKMD